MGEGRKCEWCDGPMDGKRSDARFCTKACNQKANWARRRESVCAQNRLKRLESAPEIVCDNCGKHFLRKKGQGGDRRKFCSVSCFREAKNRSRRKGLGTRMCRGCGEIFEKNGTNQVFCSRRCLERNSSKLIAWRLERGRSKRTGINIQSVLLTIPKILDQLDKTGDQK